MFSQRLWADRPEEYKWERDRKTTNRENQCGDDRTRSYACGARGSLRSRILGLSRPAGRPAGASGSGPALPGAALSGAAQPAQPATESEQAAKPEPAAIQNRPGPQFQNRPSAPYQARPQGNGIRRPAPGYAAPRPNYPAVPNRAPGYRAGPYGQPGPAFLCLPAPPPGHLGDWLNQHRGQPVAEPGADAAQRSQLQPAARRRPAAAGAAVAPGEPVAGGAAPTPPGPQRDAGAHVAPGAHADSILPAAAGRFAARSPGPGEEAPSAIWAPFRSTSARLCSTPAATRASSAPTSAASSPIFCAPSLPAAPR